MQQLHMVHPDPASVGPARPPEGYVLRTFRPGDERAWAEVVNTTDMGGDYDVTKVRQTLTGEATFDPEGLVLGFDARTQRPMATACGWWTFRAGRRRPMLHMVAARPEARGMGLGRAVCQAVLNYFARKGYPQAVLTTDDHRLPAIATYLRLGFLPMRFVRGEDHLPRWEAIFSSLAGKCGRLRLAGRGRCVTIAVLGLRRGVDLAEYARRHPGASVQAGCDVDGDARRSFAERFAPVKVEERFDALLAGEADAVIVANDCPDHAPSAIAALRAGKDVLSEVTAFHTPAEGVELIETVESTHRSYTLAENCLYGSPMMELIHLAGRGQLGRMQYAEGDYVHDIRSLMTRAGKPHWRSWLPPLFYCTHPLGPILRASGERCVRVVGMHAGSKLEGARGGIDMGAMLIGCSGGSVVRIACAFAVHRRPASLWVCFYGTKGSLETDRWDDRVHLYEPGGASAAGPTSYRPTGRDGREYTAEGHFGADPRMIEYWIESLANGLSPPVDVHEAAEMTLPGILAHRSSLTGSGSVEVPDLREPAGRDACRNDRARPDPADPTRLIGL